MKIKKEQLLRLIQESVRSALKEMAMGKQNTSATLDFFESGPVTVHGIYYPPRRGTMYEPPEYPEFELHTISKDGKELTPEEFLAIENQARAEVGEDPMDEEQLYTKVEEEVLSMGPDKEDDY